VLKCVEAALAPLRRFTDLTHLARVERWLLSGRADGLTAASRAWGCAATLNPKSGLNFGARKAIVTEATPPGENRGTPAGRFVSPPCLT